MIEIDLGKVFGERLTVAAGFREWFVAASGPRPSPICWSLARLGSRIEQAEPQPMAHDLAFAWVVTPARCEHVAIDLKHDRLVPAVLDTLLRDDQIADADLLPIARQLRRDDPGGRDPPALPLAPLAGGLGG